LTPSVTEPPSEPHWLKPSRPKAEVVEPGAVGVAGALVAAPAAAVSTAALGPDPPPHATKQADSVASAAALRIRVGRKKLAAGHERIGAGKVMVSSGEL